MYPMINIIRNKLTKLGRSRCQLSSHARIPNVRHCSYFPLEFLADICRTSMRSIGTQCPRRPLGDKKKYQKKRADVLWNSCRTIMRTQRTSVGHSVPILRIRWNFMRTSAECPLDVRQNVRRTSARMSVGHPQNFRRTSARMHYCT